MLPVSYTHLTEPSAASQLYTETLKLKQNCTFKAITVRPAGNSRVVYSLGGHRISSYYENLVSSVGLSYASTDLADHWTESNTDA